MAGIEIKIDIRGVQRLRTVLNRLTAKAQSRTDLHARWAVLALNWINKNFVTEGGLVGGWKPLSPNTLAARQGGSGRILQDTGQLRSSFVPRWTREQASVGTPVQYAKYHEEGTPPYTIKPKLPDGVLRFMVATSTGVSRKSGLPTAKGEVVFTREVKHPGLAARRMLPRESDPLLMRQLLSAARDYMRQAERGSSE